MTEKELKKLRGYYSSLLGQQQVFDSIATSQWATKEAPVRVLAEEIERIEADFPGLLPPFRPEDFYSHPAYISGGTFYEVSGIRSYLATALGKAKAELDAAEDRGTAQSDYLGDLEDPEVKQLVREITGRFVQLGKGSPVRQAKVTLGKKRFLLDVLVRRRIIRIIDDKFYPCLLAEELEDAGTRNYIRNCTSLVLKALKSLYEMTGASQFSFDQVLTAATRQARPTTEPDMVRLGMLMAADFSDFVSGWALSGEEGVNSISVEEEILDFDSLDAAWNEELAGRLVGAAQAPPISPVEHASSTEVVAGETEAYDFSFVRDERLRRIIECDYAELKNVKAVAAVKSRLILAGGLIEALLLDTLKCHEEKALDSPKAGGKRELEEWGLGTLIDVAVELGLIGAGAQSFGHSVREYRNLVHPGKEVRSDYKVAPEEAEIAEKVLEIVIRELREERE